MNNISILVVSDLLLLRETWSQLLQADPRFKIIGECKTGEPAITFCRQYFPDIVLLDIMHPSMNELEIFNSIQEGVKNTRILVVTHFTHTSFFRKAMSYGISGYLTKNSSRSEMYEAILEISKDRKYICREIKNNMADDLIVSPKPSPSLSPREKEIVQLVSDGKSSKQIAWQLQLSIKTVEVHRYNILHKLELKNSAALINYLSQHNPAMN